MTVVDAVHGVKVAPNHVYIIQPNTSLAIADGVLSVTPRPDDRRPHYPVDHFLRSLATVQGPHAVGVILSGTGSDGTLGVCEIKAAGGLTFAQDEQSAQHAGMPQSAIASGAVDLVLPPKDIAERLTTLSEHPYLATPVFPEREFRDAVERKRLTERLARSQKLEAIGQLARNVAHEFNNVLTIIVGPCGDGRHRRSARAEPLPRRDRTGRNARRVADASTARTRTTEDSRRRGC
jgi:signal transduction histidine kinase